MSHNLWVKNHIHISNYKSHHRVWSGRWEIQNKVIQLKDQKRSPTGHSTSSQMLNTLSHARGSHLELALELKPELIGWEYKKANVSWVWMEKTSWTGEITQILGRLIREIMSSVPSVLQGKARGIPKDAQTLRAGLAQADLTLWVRNYTPNAEREPPSPNQLGQVTRSSQDRSNCPADLSHFSAGRGHFPHLLITLPRQDQSAPLPCFKPAVLGALWAWMTLRCVVNMPPGRHWLFRQ